MSLDLTKLLSACEVGRILIQVADEVDALYSLLRTVDIPEAVKFSVERSRSLIQGFLQKVCDCALKEAELVDFPPRTGVGEASIRTSKVRSRRFVRVDRFFRRPIRPAGVIGSSHLALGPPENDVEDPATSMKSVPPKTRPVQFAERMPPQKNVQLTSRSPSSVAALRLLEEARSVNRENHSAGSNPEDVLQGSVLEDFKVVQAGLRRLENPATVNDKPAELPYGFQIRAVAPPAVGHESPTRRTGGNLRLTVRQSLVKIPKPDTVVIAENLRPGVLPLIYVRNARIDQSNPNFKTFCDAFPGYTSRIWLVLDALQRFLFQYQVPLAVISPGRFGNLITRLGLRDIFSKEILLDLLENQDEVASLVKLPGWRFRGENRRDVAAVVIQSNWRRVVIRRWFVEQQRQRSAVSVISKIWLQWMRTKTIREKVQKTKHEARLFYQEKLQWLRENWSTFSNASRTHIHLPSLGWEQKLRNRMKNMSLRENRQFGRLGDLHDPSVKVIYISPVNLANQEAEYARQFFKLASICNEVPEESLSSRLTMHVPAYLDQFTVTHLCLASILKYSGTSLHALKNLVEGQEACLIGGFPHDDDLEIAQALGIPYLGTDPRVAHVYGSKSGALRVFRDAGVPTPPARGEIYSEQQFVETLSGLIALNLEIPTWLFKTNQSKDGKGFAWIHISCLACVPWLRAERNKKKDQWQFYWAHEHVLEQLQTELKEQLPKAYSIRSRSHYPTWRSFLRDFLASGGVIQGTPPASETTCLTCDLFVSPVGRLTIESVGDQICDKAPFSKLGYSIPQTSVPADVPLRKYCEMISDGASKIGIVGYFSVDFVTFLDGQEKQHLWALDWNIGYGDSTALAKLIKFSLNAWTNQNTLMLETYPYISPSRRKKLRRKDMTPQPVRRFAVASACLYHSHLEIIHPTIFFHICKSISLELDPNTKEGSMLLPVDQNRRTAMGMIVVSDTLQRALRIYSKNLRLMNEEITTTTVQGESNFVAAAKAMEKIARQGNNVDDDDD